MPTRHVSVNLRSMRHLAFPVLRPVSGSRACRRAAVALCALMLAAPGTALAASPSTTGYSETGASALPSATAAAPQSATAGAVAVAAKGSSLPFTGADVGLAVLGGVILLSLGLVLRRTTRTTP